jgi:glyoxylase-like metal-dependent hydrolase (beta-lactamase superfamily II)
VIHAICTTCGTQFAETKNWPERCPICNDQRQHIGFDGQRWTTLEQLRTDHKTRIADEEPGLTSFVIDPHFGIGQRAFLIETPEGNILWDCISLLDEPTIERIRSSGGLAAICISHPHYYTTMVEWSRTFGNVPVYLHRDDAQWVMRHDACVHFWTGETKALPGGLTLIRCGGHFDGAAVLYWPGGASGSGVLLSGDTIQVVSDRRFVSFMYSYPNYIPLNACAVRRIVDAVEPFAFDRLYGAFPKLTIQSDAKAAIRRSADRYLRAIGAN